jgi:DNA-binding response OmpR family regulator
MNSNVLIADDDADIVDLLTLRCRECGLNVDSANNAMTALGKIEEMLPDVVILDIDMPYGNGLSVCEMMSSHAALRAIPVIIMTGNTSEETVRRCHQMCAFYVLKSSNLWSRVKPVLNYLFERRKAAPCNRLVGVENLAASEPLGICARALS